MFFRLNISWLKKKNSYSFKIFNKKCIDFNSEDDFFAFKLIIQSIINSFHSKIILL